MISEARWYGGLRLIISTGGVVAVGLRRRFYVVEPSTGNLFLDLPDARTLRPGGPIAFVRNIGTTSCRVRDASANQILQVDPGQVGTILLVSNTTAAGTWATGIVTPSSLPANVLKHLGYLMGGGPANLDSLWKYDAVLDSWAAGTTAPRGREFAGGFSQRGRGLWVGDHAIGADSPKLDEHSAGSWIGRTDCPYSPGKCQAAAAAGRGFVFGGAGERAVAEYSLDAWAVKADLGSKINSGVATALHGKIYLLSGLPAKQTNLRFEPEIEAYAEIQGQPSFDRAHMTAFAFGDEVWMAGGWDEGLIYSDDVESYEPKTDTWTTRTALSLGQRYAGAGLAADHRGYYLGGSDNTGTASAAAARMVNNAWSAIAAISAAKTNIANHGVAAP